jgi:hypothetical protein
MRILAASLAFLAFAGCHGEFEIRKDPDLLHVDPRDARYLFPPEIEPGYMPQVTDPASWQIHASLDGRDAMIDGDPSTRATSRDDHRQGEFILIDLGCECYFQTVRQVHPPDSGQPPRYRVDTAGEHGFPYTLQFLGSGQPGETLAIFTHPVHARFIRITAIEDSATPWYVSELQIE